MVKADTRLVLKISIAYTNLILCGSDNCCNLMQFMIIMQVIGSKTRTFAWTDIIMITDQTETQSLLVFGPSLLG